jgi:hypothetical protein
MKKVIPVILAAMLAGGCLTKRLTTDYTLEDLYAKEYPSLSALHDEGPLDTDETALKAYNLMLGEVEDKIGTDYYIYDFYYVDFPGMESYAIKILPNPWTNVKVGDAVMLFCKPDGSGMESGLDWFLAARNWSHDLEEELSRAVPDCHFNTWDVAYDYMVTTRSEWPSDYKYLLSQIRQYDLSVNLIVPAGTPVSEADEIYSKVTGILNRYEVTVTDIVCPESDEAMQEFLDEEKVTGNSYTYDDRVEWLRTYTGK